MGELVNEGVLLGMGNPLLDISATVKPEMLAKYDLKVTKLQQKRRSVTIYQQL